MLGPTAPELLRCPGCQLAGRWPVAAPQAVHAGVTWSDGYSYFAGHAPVPALVACPRCHRVHTPRVERMPAPPFRAEAPRPAPPRLLLVQVNAARADALSVLRRHSALSPAELAGLLQTLPVHVPLRAEKHGNDQHRWAAINQARRELRAAGAEVRFDPPVEQHQHLGEAVASPAMLALARELRDAVPFEMPSVVACLGEADRLAAGEAAREASPAGLELAILQQAFWESGHGVRPGDDPEAAPVVPAAVPAEVRPALERLVALASASGEAWDHVLAAEALRRMGRFAEAIAMAQRYEGSEWEHELPVATVLEMARAGRTELAIASRWVA